MKERRRGAAKERHGSGMRESRGPRAATRPEDEDQDENEEAR